MISNILREVGCLKKLLNFKIVRDLTEVDKNNNDRIEKKKELIDRYHEAAEEIDSGLPIPKCKPLLLVTYYDSNLVHDRVTRKSIDDVVGMVGKQILFMNQKDKLA